MPVEFQIPSLRIQVKERLSEKESERIRLTTLLELEENRIASLLQLELEQRRRKAFVDRHRRGNEKEFEVGKPVLLFQTRMGNMLGKITISVDRTVLDHQGVQWVVSAWYVVRRSHREMGKWVSAKTV